MNAFKEFATRGLLLCSMAISTHVFGQTPQQIDQARNKMVDEHIVTGGVKNKRVLDAMRTTPRQEFLSITNRSRAYLDMAIAIGDKQTISSPFIVAYMTESLDPQPTDRVLEIGTGSGYQAAVLSPLVKDVYSIEIVETLGKRAERTLQRLKYDNVHVKIGDGYQGWPEFAPFDKIIVTCSPEKVPEKLVEQLREGGMMVVPVGERYQQTLYLLKKKDGKLESVALLPTLFVPMTGTAESQRVVKPDPSNPQVVNGNFEEKAFENGAQPGWYYERQIGWITSKDAPVGEHYVTFRNQIAGVPAHLMQGFAIDGRKVGEIEFSARVKTKDAQIGDHKDSLPAVVISLYDDDRKELGHWVAGPVRGTTEWHEQAKKIQIPPNTREGIIRIGLFGGIGEASFDNVRIRKTLGK